MREGDGGRVGDGERQWTEEVERDVTEEISRCETI